jgi:hypothetical protein
MSCKQIREAIDAASGHASYGGHVASHLSGCPDCHRYSDEAASLLRLLSAQPRVEAPPDFEFRLRARIANAQAAPAIDPRGFLQKIRPWTFSWGQTVAAAAALTFVVTVSALYINSYKIAQGPGGEIAKRAPDSQPNGQGQTPIIKTPIVGSVGVTPVKFSSRNAKVRLAPFQSESPTQSNSVAGSVAGSDGPAPLYSTETKRLLKDRSVFYGAETASINSVKPVGVALTF